MSAREPYYRSEIVQLYLGDALEVARDLPSQLARTIVTSPPYYALRDYGHDAQIGSEPTMQAYVDRLVDLFRELRRVLADDGTLWLNLGDTYANRSSGDPRDRDLAFAKSTIMGGLRHQANASAAAGRLRDRELPAKSLLGIPWRVALAMQADGWILRSEIIWAKPNPMPEAVQDRPSKAHEQIFLFAKSPSYYYDADAIAEKLATGESAAAAASWASLDLDETEQIRPELRAWQARGMRNKRDVWTVAGGGFEGEHVAVFPPELIRPCIRAGSAVGDVVLDPFSGSGTAGMVAGQEFRRYVGIDLSAEYLDLSLRTRFQQPTLALSDWESAP